jgi:hypothetical protein
MSVYGLRIRDASGVVILDATDRITRLRYSTIATAGASGSVTLDDINTIESIEITVPINASWSSHPHTVSRTANTIAWQALSDAQGHFPSSASAIFVFLYT